jgi:hypothetical protein
MNDFNYLQFLHHALMFAQIVAWTFLVLGLWKLRFVVKSRWVHVGFFATWSSLGFMLMTGTLLSLVEFLPSDLVLRIFDIPYLFSTFSVLATISMLVGMFCLIGIMATRFGGTLAKPAEKSH